MIPDNWLITGGCGFIGTSLIAHIIKEKPDINIRVLDNLSAGSRGNLLEVTSFVEKEYSVLSDGPKGIELIVGDIRDYAICLQSCRGADIVIHLAANAGVGPSVENPRLDMEINVVGTFNMLEAARFNNVNKFIFASSGAPIGEVEPPIHEEKAPKPASPYGASKLAGEGYCSSYCRTFGLKTVSLRFGNVYGPLSKHKNSVVAKFFKKALSGDPLEIYGNGSQTRDFIYIDDLIQAILLSLKSDIEGETFQIATRKETTVNEIAHMIQDMVSQATGKRVEVVHSQSRLGDMKRNYSDISKAEKILGYKPKFDLYKGIQNTFNYFRGVF
ncbi:MAG: NAD-dependent epimerase/dehydratase family protein [Nitrospirota bacterium]